MPTVGGLEVSEQELEELRQLFNMVDTDGGGTISEGEVHDLMSMLGMNISALEVRTMVREIDINGNGMVDFEEFVQVVVGQKALPFSRNDVLRAFRIFSKQGLPAGHIDPPSLEAALVNYFPAVNADEAHELVAQLPVNADGLINFHDQVDIFLSAGLDAQATS